MKKAIYKVPNGKLLKIFLEDADGQIVSIKITGDFFAHPEENIEKLEAALVGVAVSKEDLVQKITEFKEKTGTVFFGFDAESLATTILSAI